MKRYQSVFFDLDHTLWDYDTNAREALLDLFEHFHLAGKTAHSFEVFHRSFTDINTRLWARYDAGEITRDIIRYHRFHHVFQSVGINQYELSLRFSEAYVRESPRKGHLMPHARALLEYLRPRYRLCIITNGFEDIQRTKLESSGLTDFFDDMITSEKAGCKKPHPGIFAHALAACQAKPAEALMVGDNLLTDMAGARSAAIDTAFFNPGRQLHEELTTYEVHQLDQLQAIL